MTKKADSKNIGEITGIIFCAFFNLQNVPPSNDAILHIWTFSSKKCQWYSCSASRTYNIKSATIINRYSPLWCNVINMSAHLMTSEGLICMFWPRAGCCTFWFEMANFKARKLVDRALWTLYLKLDNYELVEHAFLFSAVKRGSKSYFHRHFKSIN